MLTFKPLWRTAQALFVREARAKSYHALLLCAMSHPELCASTHTEEASSCPTPLAKPGFLL